MTRQIESEKDTADQVWLMFWFACVQSCSRQLVTVDLNLTNAEFIQFYFMYGCMIPPSNRNQGVLLEYSLNGGINWHLLTEIFYDLYTKPGWVYYTWWLLFANWPTKKWSMISVNLSVQICECAAAPCCPPRRSACALVAASAWGTGSQRLGSG